MGILKKQPRGKPFQKGFDERRNIEGAPKRGESQAEVYGKLMDLPAEDLADLYGRDNELGRAFAKMPKGVPLKILLAGRNLAAEMFEPSTSRMNMIMDRTEGKVQDKLDLTSNGEQIETKVDDERFDRAISTLADAVRESISGKSAGADSKVDTTE